jgi:hypothetical protein
MAKEDQSTKYDVSQKKVGKKSYRRDINKGYVILYLAVFIMIIVGEIVLYNLQDKFSLSELAQNIIGNLMGVLAAFLIFDIAHEKISKDSYASEVSEQILDTLMYHPEAMELYQNDQKKVFVNAFIGSIVDDPDATEMINNHLNSYLLTEKDFSEKKDLTEKDCRIRTAFSYRFVLETERTSAFGDLCAPIVGDADPYFYVQEELNYKVKYLAQKGNYTDQHRVKIGFIYDNAALDRFLRGNKSDQNDELLKNCLFRESLDIEEVDKQMLQEHAEDKVKLIALIKKMFRPHLNIDRCRGEIVDVNVVPDSGVIIAFQVNHDCEAMEHTIDIVFHIPKKWNTIVEVALVEPTKEPRISLSYNEDAMDVEMYSFLNKGESSSYENASENENGVFSIALSGEWVFPISGVVFPVRRELRKKEDK